MEKAADPVDEDKEPVKEGVQEDAENGSKGIEKIDNEEVHEINIRLYLLLV